MQDIPDNSKVSPILSGRLESEKEQVEEDKGTFQDDFSDPKSLCKGYLFLTWH